MDEKTKKKIAAGAAIAVVSGAAITGTVVGAAKYLELDYEPRNEYVVAYYGPANDFPSETNSEGGTRVPGFN